eukprot:gnl/Chilomastix_caulleri/6158.p2 GENE.gnl/Chilomastix_caulleri/6158~~gnl/Chilomastix_caulleri/6158.p2  ORF type:complete len:52 (+),score=18.70 gnl/Chilomastix_caulleri/6158:353-508(+)
MEHVNYTPKGLDALITVAQGDMRSCLNAAQSAAGYATLESTSEGMETDKEQ